MTDIRKSPSTNQQAPLEDGENFEEELDEFDLLEPNIDGQEEGLDNAFAETDLTATTRAFNTRIQRKKKEQEEAHGQAEKAARIRHTFMFKALMNVRKSLREVTRIDLGERFEFSLDADDWQGWPRLAIKLVDSDRRDDDYLQLTVTAHDRHASGTIEISFSDSTKPEKISLARDGDLKRLPNILRKCVRTYLDLVGDIVLDAEHDPNDPDGDGSLENKDISEFENKDQNNPTDTLTGDLFEEDFEAQDLLDKLPTIDDLESLPELLSQKENESDKH